MKKAWIFFIGLSLLFFSSSGIALAEVNMTLKIDGVDGESKNKYHEDEILVLSWSWGMSQSGTTHVGGGGGAGKASVQDVSLIKYFDKASAALMLACLEGEPFKEAILTVTKVGTGSVPFDYLVITMSPVLVTSVSTGGSGGEDRLTENVTLNFANVNLSYTTQNEDGSRDATIDFTWNIEENREE